MRRRRKLIAFVQVAGGLLKRPGAGGPAPKEAGSGGWHVSRRLANGPQPETGRTCPQGMGIDGDSVFTASPETANMSRRRRGEDLLRQAKRKEVRTRRRGAAGLRVRDRRQRSAGWREVPHEQVELGVDAKLIACPADRHDRHIYINAHCRARRSSRDPHFVQAVRCRAFIRQDDPVEGAQPEEHTWAPIRTSRSRR